MFIVGAQSVDPTSFTSIERLEQVSFIYILTESSSNKFINVLTELFHLDSMMFWDCDI